MGKRIILKSNDGQVVVLNPLPSLLESSDSFYINGKNIKMKDSKQLTFASEDQLKTLGF